MISLQVGKTTQTSRDEPALIFPVKVASSRQKRFIAIFAHPRRFGIEVLLEKPTNAIASGNLASLCRTWGQSISVSRVLFHSAERQWWLVLGPDPLQPHAYIRLVGGSAAELAVIELQPEPCVRMRFATTGVFTKRRPVDFLMPHQISEEDLAQFSDMTADLAAKIVDGPGSESMAAGQEQLELDSAAGTAVLLPPWQREARDRLARRIKTLRRSLSKRQGELPGLETIESVRQEAQATLVEGRSSEIDDAFNQFKKIKKSAELIGQHMRLLESNLLQAEADLEILRASILPVGSVHEILERHGLKEKQVSSVARQSGRQGRPERGKFHVAKGWHEFVIKGDIRILVAKDAKSGDALVKSAAANDWWVHVVDGTGSHVIVPAAQVRGVKFTSKLPEAVLRAAAILALYNSRWRDSKSGEVYVSRKSSLKKRKGDPPGLWQVMRSSTLMIRFDDSELESVLQWRR